MPERSRRTPLDLFPSEQVRVSPASLERQPGSPLNPTSSPRPQQAGSARHPSRRLAAVALTVSFVTPSFFVLRAWAQRWSTSDVTMVPQQKTPGVRDIAAIPPQAGRPTAEHAKVSEPAARPVTRSVALPEPTSPPDAASAAGSSAGSAGPTIQHDILAKDREWFDAYYAADSRRMAALSADTFTMEDKRRVALRLPIGGQPITRTLDRVRIDQDGVAAVLSARMTERGVIDGTLRESVAMLAEVWVHRDDAWRLTGIRIAEAPGGR